MFIQAIRRFQYIVLNFGLLTPGLLFFALSGLVLADSGKTKVLYHVDGKDPDVANYAMA